LEFDGRVPGLLVLTLFAFDRSPVSLPTIHRNWHSSIQQVVFVRAADSKSNRSSSSQQQQQLTRASSPPKPIVDSSLDRSIQPPPHHTQTSH
jgi:hypothetical protein